ncbi:hypothetical protein XM38_033830 [Halomicronema hongdechloris C2206]|uniref:DUF3288 domain-containing protein n=1 Tax=Halomicronema hongdechloris C2206 TaxID=1641165 RepID=A0A1Z3HQB1_9CYAN|nr:DUF3288 family protein [Halomicronema hongdechloris]ASC72426.1 hypothetical protein XM38_033830 [Halomicronema hongdechloris C2206]
MSANGVERGEQQHPQYRVDRQTVNQLIAGDPSNTNLIELARLLIRYKGFPGAQDIQQDLQATLQRWDLTEDSLYEQTRSLHQQGLGYRHGGREGEDWS